jgi:senataxin
MWSEAEREADLEKQIVNSVYIDLGPNRSRVDMLLRSAMQNALDIHAGVITGIALNHKEYPSGPIWDPARRTAIDFLFKVLMADGDNVRRFLTNMGRQALDARQRKGPDPNDFFPKMTFAEHVWKKIYATAGSRDIHGIVMLIRGIMRFAHLPTPRGNAWGHTGLEFWKSEGKWAASMVSVTSAMKVMKEGFGDKLTTFVAASDPRNLKGLFDTPRVPEAVIRLLLCSDADVHDTIIGLIQGIFDEVEERVDCFRAMFLHFPAQSISALQDYLNKWVEDALSLPTAVDSARWLVRCFTDILEVLCRQSGAGSGLAFLRDPAFLEIKTASGSMKDDISALWDCMTKALAVIIKRTPKWAPFYENAEMVDWMQDALIFGRLLVEENRTFEGAALGTAVSYRESPAIEVPSQATDVGGKMIRQLEQVLDSLTSWLRLTEVETLHQTYELIKSLLDRLTKTHVNQSPSASLMVSFTTVDGYCRRQKGHKSKLNDSELAELADLIRPYIKVEEVLDDEVEYVSTSAGRSSNLTKEALAIPSQQRKNAFQELMKNAQKGATPRSKADRDASSNQVTPRTSPDIIDVDDFDDDEFDDMLAGVDLAEIDAIERSAVNKETQRKLLQSQALKTGNLNKRIGLPPGKPPAPKIPPKPAAPVIRGSGLLSRIRREVAAENRDNKVPVIKKIDRGLVLPKIDLNSREKTPSESSASSDSENEGGGLAALKRLQKISPKKLTVMANKPRVVAARRPELSAAERQRLNAQRTKLRLKPDMTGLWSTMLKWDPQQHDFEDKLPNRLPGKFKTVEEHVRTYLPLFYRELRDQSLNELKEATNPVILTIEIGSRQHTDDFIDMELSIVGNIPFGWYANEYDVCLLQFDGRTIFVKVQAFKRSPRNTTLHVRMDSTKDSMGLAVKSRCQLRKHMNMSTAAREYAALKGLPYYEPELLQSILDAKPTALPEIPQVTWEKAMIAYNVNEPQAKAIIGSMRIKGFALIQGPPGTGKTKTISGLAGRFMTERPTHISLQGSEKTVNAKLLICAPSNAAIDEVTRRLKDGVPTSDGKMVVPRIVRLGAESSMNAAVTDVSLDSLIEARVSSVKAKGGDNDIQMKRVELALEEIKQKREAKQAELSHVGNDDEKRRTIEAELAGLVQQRILKSKEINKFRDAARDSGRQLDGARREARERILQDADIICSTLAGAGHDSIASFQFETVIIDEAAQSVEPSALVPLKYGCTRCILVGGQSSRTTESHAILRETFCFSRSAAVASYCYLHKSGEYWV